MSSACIAACSRRSRAAVIFLPPRGRRVVVPSASGVCTALAAGCETTRGGGGGVAEGTRIGSRGLGLAGRSHWGRRGAPSRSRSGPNQVDDAAGIGAFLAGGLLPWRGRRMRHGAAPARLGRAGVPRVDARRLLPLPFGWRLRRAVGFGRVRGEGDGVGSASAASSSAWSSSEVVSTSRNATGLPFTHPILICCALWVAAGQLFGRLLPAYPAASAAVAPARCDH